MSEWRSTSLGDVTESMDALRRPVKESERTSGKFPYYGASGVVDYVGDYLFDETLLLVSEDGENLRTRKTPVAFLATGQYWVNNHAHVLRATADNDLRFICAALQLTDLSGFLTGSTQPKLTARNLVQIPMRVPELVEQRRIAGVLGALDDLIDTNRRLCKRLEDAARATAASSPADTALADLARPAHGKQVKPAGLVEHYSLPAFDRGAEAEIIDAGEIKSNKLRLTGPTVLISRLNPRWERCWMVYPGPNAMCSPEFVAAFGNGAAPEEVWAVASASEFWDQMRSMVTGTTGSHQRVDKDSVFTLDVPDTRQLPAASRSHIVDLVRAAHGCRDEVADLTRARDELLPLLMSGRVRVREGVV